MQEKIPSDEAADTKRLIQTFGTLIRREYARGVRPAPRDAHPKGQGCVRARFTVHPAIATAFRYGVFAVPRSYTAWIRYSNGAPQKRADNIGDGRGMAIKITGFKGPKLLADEHGTQDFVMINFPVFFSPNAHDYLDLSRSTLDHTETSFFKTHTRDAAILHAINTHVTRDMFAETYFSMSPYTLGKRYMKFRAVPARCAQGPALPAYAQALPTAADFLRARMAHDLSRGNVCFAFQIQLQTNAATQPIEDASTEWKPSEAPYTTVAEIVIPKQQFASDAQQTFCENLSYSPWHASVDQRPAGGINRIRLAVYRASSALRHELDGVAGREPTGHETFDKP